MKKILCTILLTTVCMCSYGQISFTSSGSNLLVTNYGIRASYPKERLSTFLNSQYLEIKSDERTILIVKDYTIVSSPASSSLSDLQDKLLPLLAVSVGGGGSVTPSSTDVFTNKSMSGSTNTFSNIPYAALTSTPTTLSGYGISDATPSSRTLTINGTALNLTTNRSWSVGDVLTTSTYDNPTWLNSLAFSKLSSKPTTVSGYGINDAVDLSSTQANIAGAKTFTSLGTFSSGLGVTGTLTTTGDIVPEANGTRNSGSSTLKWLNLYTTTVNGNGVLNLRSSTSTAILFQQSSTSNAVGGFFQTTGELFLQAPGTTPSNLGERLQVYGNARIAGTTRTTGTLIIDKTTGDIKTKSPNGSWWAITVSDAGAIVVSSTTAP